MNYKDKDFEAILVKANFPKKPIYTDEEIECLLNIRSVNTLVKLGVLRRPLTHGEVSLFFSANNSYISSKEWVRSTEAIKYLGVTHTTFYSMVSPKGNKIRSSYNSVTYTKLYNTEDLIIVKRQIEERKLKRKLK